MAGIGKLFQEFAYTPNGPEPTIALEEKDVPYSLPRLRFRIRHSVENKATDLGLQNRAERFPPTGGRDDLPYRKKFSLIALSELTG
jgi:hypothetical protein